MANLEINVPDDLHKRLRLVIGAGDGEDADNGAVCEFALAVIRREVERLESGKRQEKHGADPGKERREQQADVSRDDA